ncbi:hypothetical protein T484DRAFT_3139348 [Baffinella frigidus]|nr:hypothetical protein T484DRAFT_3139348 [Cryptophyta sp. CCMP2293]
MASRRSRILLLGALLQCAHSFTPPVHAPLLRTPRPFCRTTLAPSPAASLHKSAPRVSGWRGPGGVLALSSQDGDGVRQLPSVEIEYCTGCRWMLRAAWLAQELLTT